MVCNLLEIDVSGDLETMVSLLCLLSDKEKGETEF